MEPYAGINTSRLLLGAMNVARANHNLIANNIANVDTPGYNPVHLDFKQTLQNELTGRGQISLRESRPTHMSSRQFHSKLDGLVLQSKNDYNKVDIDKEIADLTKNSGDYTTYGSLLVKQFQMVKRVLQTQA